MSKRTKTEMQTPKKKSGGWSSKYYQFPKGSTELDNLITHKSMPWHIANIFKACYRFGSKNEEMYELDKMAWMLAMEYKDRGKLPLLVKKLKTTENTPHFNASVQSDTCPEKNGLVAYYSNRCPFAEFHAKTSLEETAKKRNLPLKIIKLKTMEDAQKAPSPATIFSLYYQGKFVTTDISVCMDTRYDKIMEKHLK